MTSCDITRAANCIGLKTHCSDGSAQCMGGRKITATLTGETLERSVAKGCLQRGILLTQSCGDWLYMNSQRDSGMAVIQWRIYYSHQQKIPKYSLTASLGRFEYGTTMMW